MILLLAQLCMSFRMTLKPHKSWQNYFIKYQSRFLEVMDLEKLFLHLLRRLWEEKNPDMISSVGLIFCAHLLCYWVWKKRWRHLIIFFYLQSQRPISMKKENIQSRNRKLSAKTRKKHNSFTADMLKPFEKMYSSYGMTAAGAAAAAGMGPMSSAMTSAGMGSSYYMPPHQASAAAAASTSMHTQFGGASMHHMAAPFGSSFGGMVSSNHWYCCVVCHIQAGTSMHQLVVH